MLFANCQSMQPHTHDNYMIIYVVNEMAHRKGIARRYQFSVVQTAVQEISDCWLWLRQYNRSAQFEEKIFQAIEAVCKLSINATARNDNYMKIHVGMSGRSKRYFPQISSFGGTDSGTRYFRLLTLTATRITDSTFWKRYFRLLNLLQIVNQCNHAQWQLHENTCRNEWPIEKVFSTDIIFRWYRQRYKIFRLLTLTATV